MGCGSSETLTKMIRNDGVFMNFPSLKAGVLKLSGSRFVSFQFLQIKDEVIPGSSRRQRNWKRGTPHPRLEVDDCRKAIERDPKNIKAGDAGE